MPVARLAVRRDGRGRRRLASVKSQRNRSVEFVVERLETIEDLAEDVVPRERLHRVEWRRGAGSHGSGTEGLRIKMRRADCLNSTSPMFAGEADEERRCNWVLLGRHTLRAGRGRLGGERRELLAAKGGSREPPAALCRLR